MAVRVQPMRTAARPSENALQKHYRNNCTSSAIRQFGNPSNARSTGLAESLVTIIIKRIHFSTAVQGLINSECYYSQSRSPIEPSRALSLLSSLTLKTGLAPHFPSVFLSFLLFSCRSWPCFYPQVFPIAGPFGRACSLQPSPWPSATSM